MSSESPAAARRDAFLDAYFESFDGFMVCVKIMSFTIVGFLFYLLIRWARGIQEVSGMAMAVFVSVFAGEMVVSYMWYKSLVRLLEKIPKPESV
ncbi:hypothetical protein PsYK624_084170 [Phanerochaete sordida]|uniref:DUF4282 domain-containing protein n=1 Tax=Phanerochaete sordida TaxID=48140 RepID=A0A9P3LF62_9APHY|nr:hypothetical protein PsYK624_084170 [Phanerochaete sordida]